MNALLPPDGLTRVLQLGCEASTALEYTANPTIQDKKKAQGLFERAAKAMKFIVGLEEEGIYQTGPLPTDQMEERLNDPKEYRIELPEVRVEIVAEEALVVLPPLPEELELFGTWDDAAQVEEFDRRLQALAEGLDEHIYPPWEIAWEANRLDAFTRLLIAESREPRSFVLPTDEEVATWRSQYAAPLLPMPDLFLAGFLEADAEGQKIAFECGLEDLKQTGFEALPDVTSWEDAPWWAAFDADRTAAWQKLIFATHHREPFSFLVPTDEEFATWAGQFATPEVPEEPEHLVNFRAWDQEEQLRQFEALLQLLEDAGIAEGMKLKQWKPFGKEWNDLFISDREKAWDRLWTGYHTLGCACGFRIPTEEEIAQALAEPAEESPAVSPIQIGMEVLGKANYAATKEGRYRVTGLKGDRAELVNLENGKKITLPLGYLRPSPAAEIPLEVDPFDAQEGGEK